MRLVDLCNCCWYEQINLLFKYFGTSVLIFTTYHIAFPFTTIYSHPGPRMMGWLRISWFVIQYTYLLILLLLLLIYTICRVLINPSSRYLQIKFVKVSKRFCQNQDKKWLHISYLNGILLRVNCSSFLAWNFSKGLIPEVLNNGCFCYLMNPLSFVLLEFLELISLF